MVLQSPGRINVPLGGALEPGVCSSCQGSNNIKAGTEVVLHPGLGFRGLGFMLNVEAQRG